jgi:hypothetical protein
LTIAIFIAAPWFALAMVASLIAFVAAGSRGFDAAWEVALWPIEYLVEPLLWGRDAGP